MENNSLRSSHDNDVHWAISHGVDVLPHIYDDNISIAIWQRALSEEVTCYVDTLLQGTTKIALKLSGTPTIFDKALKTIFPDIHVNQTVLSSAQLIDDILLVIDMFSCLFDTANVGLRINTLEQSMCPRFHVDHVPVRLITTYGGAGTEWLPDAYADRTKLGPHIKRTNNSECDVMIQENKIQQLNAGDVALMKGEKWDGNEGRGLIHRSPHSASTSTKTNVRRLLITCDLVN